MNWFKKIGKVKMFPIFYEIDLYQYSVNSTWKDEHVYENYHTYVEGGNHQLTQQEYKKI